MCNTWRSVWAMAALLASLAAILLSIPSPPQSQPLAAATSTAVEMAARDPLERFTFGGELSDADYATIRRLVLMDKPLETNISRIEFRGPAKIEEWTQPKNLRPLSGGGDIITMERQAKGWVIVDHNYWIG